MLLSCLVTFFLLVEHGFLPEELTPKSLAKFMYDSDNLSKAIIGEYIAKRDDVNIETLKEFVNLFSFEGVCTFGIPCAEEESRFNTIILNYRDELMKP